LISQTQTEPFNRGHDDLSTQYGVLTVDGLTFADIRSGDFMPLIQISDNNPTGQAASHFRDVKLVNWTGSRNRALVNLGGGPRRQPQTEKGVPIYLHDWFGPGRHALVVSTRSGEFKEHAGEFRSEPLLTGDESRTAEVKDLPFPHLLDPVDDLPPTTVITHVHRRADGTVMVRGTTTDNGTVARVRLNGQPARPVAANFAEWEIILDQPAPRATRLSAQAEDAAGNVETRPHVMTR
jgi:hypothetical protein